MLCRWLNLRCLLQRSLNCSKHSDTLACAHWICCAPRTWTNEHWIIIKIRMDAMLAGVCSLLQCQWCHEFMNAVDSPLPLLLSIAKRKNCGNRQPELFWLFGSVPIKFTISQYNDHRAIHRPSNMYGTETASCVRCEIHFYKNAPNLFIASRITILQFGSSNANEHRS